MVKMAQKKGKKSKPGKKKKKGNRIFTKLLIIALIVVALLLINQLLPEPDKVAARVNGEPIYLDEVESTYNQLDGTQKLYLNKGVILDLLIDNKLLVQQAKREGYNISEQEVDRMVQAYRIYLPKEQFEKTVMGSKKKRERFREDIRENLLIQKFLQDKIKGLKVTAEEMVAFLEKYQGMFTGELIKARHILVDSREEAQEILSQLRNGSDFIQLAKERSIGNTAKSGGDLGWVGKDTMVPEFEEAAFSLDVGEISEVVETQLGYHIIKVYNKTNVSQPKLEQIRPLVESSLFNTKLQKHKAKLEKLLKKIRNQSEVEVLIEFAEGAPTTTTPSRGFQSTTVSQPTSTTEPISENPCLSRHGVYHDLIFYFSEENQRSLDMLEKVQELQNQGYEIYYIKMKADSQVISECYPEFNQQLVPQLICTSTGEINTGELSKPQLTQFAENCSP